MALKVLLIQDSEVSSIECRTGLELVLDRALV